MNVRSALSLAALTVAALLLVRVLREESHEGVSGVSLKPNSPVAAVVAETLHNHEGEDSPFVHAFEAALEHQAG